MRDEQAIADNYNLKTIRAALALSEARQGDDSTVVTLKIVETSYVEISVSKVEIEHYDPEDLDPGEAARQKYFIEGSEEVQFIKSDVTVDRIVTPPTGDPTDATK